MSGGSASREQHAVPMRADFGKESHLYSLEQKGRWNGKNGVHVKRSNEPRGNGGGEDSPRKMTFKARDRTLNKHHGFPKKKKKQRNNKGDQQRNLVVPTYQSCSNSEEIILSHRGMSSFHSTEQVAKESIKRPKGGKIVSLIPSEGFKDPLREKGGMLYLFEILEKTTRIVPSGRMIETHKKRRPKSVNV